VAGWTAHVDMRWLKGKKFLGPTGNPAQNLSFTQAELHQSTHILQKNNFIEDHHN
jgi:hypothetical protein